MNRYCKLCLKVDADFNYKINLRTNEPADNWLWIVQNCSLSGASTHFRHWGPTFPFSPFPSFPLPLPSLPPPLIPLRSLGSAVSSSSGSGWSPATKRILVHFDKIKAFQGSDFLSFVAELWNIYIKLKGTVKFWKTIIITCIVIIIINQDLSPQEAEKEYLKCKERREHISLLEWRELLPSRWSIWTMTTVRVLHLCHSASQRLSYISIRYLLTPQLHMNLLLTLTIIIYANVL